ncbi:MAG: DUF1116 domain-containing protein [Nocardioides sp.]
MSTPHVVSVGVDLLAQAVDDQAAPVSRVDWRPPMPGTEDDLAAVALDPLRPAANALALERMLGVQALLVDVLPAHEAVGLERGEFLHAGPPIDWTRASGPLRGALMGGAVLEGLVDTPEEAEALLEGGLHVRLEPCHHRRAVGPMAGVVTPSMWMFVLEDPATGARTHCTLNEGLGKVLRYGAYSPEVLTRLRWMNDVLGPLLQGAVRGSVAQGQPVDVTAILGQMLQMGDEAHNRNRAGTLMLLRDLGPALVSSGADADRRRRGAAVRRRQRPLLPQPRDARVQAGPRRRARRPGLDDGRRDVPQRHGLRHPDRRCRRRVVHRAGAGRRRALPRRLRTRRRQPRHRRLGDHRDRRARGLRDGDRTGDRPLRGRLGARRAGHHPPDAGDHPRRRTRAGASRCWSSPAYRPGSTSPACAAPGSSPRSTPGWPAAWPESARSAPAWSPHPPRSSPSPWPASPSSPAADRDSSQR